MFDQNPLLGPGTSTFSSHLIEILLMLLVAFILGWLLRRFLSGNSENKGVDEEIYKGVLNENKNLKNKIASLDTSTPKNDKLQLRINELEAQNNSLLVFRDTAERNNNLKLEYDNLKSQFAKLSNEQTPLLAIKDKYANLEAENMALSGFEDKYLKLKKEYDSLLAKSDNKSATDISGGAMAFAAAPLVPEAIEYDVLNPKTNLDTTNEAANVSANIAKAEAEILSLKNEVEKQKRQIEKFKEYEAESRELAGIKGRMAIMEEEAKEMKKMSAKANEADTYLAKISELESQITEHKNNAAANDNASVDLANMQNRVAELEQLVATQNSSNDELKRLKLSLEEVNQANDNLSNKLNEKTTELQNAITICNGLQTQLEAQQGSSSEATHLSNELATYKQENERLKAEATQNNFDKDKISALELQAATAVALQTTKENLESEIAALQLRINESMNRESDCKKMVDSLSAELNEAKNKIANSDTAMPVAMAAGIGAATITRDDLKIVEGIGPKIEELLHNAGILTFADLANTPADKVKEILLRDGGERYRIHDPSTWGRQSELARDGKWDELKALQDELTAGRDNG